MLKQEIEQSGVYKFVKIMSVWMDKYFLDAVMGLVPWIGDMFSTFCTLPFVYLSVFKIRSIPLTLAVLFNALADTLIGMVPFMIGNIYDVFYRSNLKNIRLITGFVEQDKAIVHEVNKKAVWMGIGIFILLVLIVLLAMLLRSVYIGISNWLLG